MFTLHCCCIFFIFGRFGDLMGAYCLSLVIFVFSLQAILDHEWQKSVRQRIKEINIVGGDSPIHHESTAQGTLPFLASDMTWKLTGLETDSLQLCAADNHPAVGCGGSWYPTWRWQFFTPLLGVESWVWSTKCAAADNRKTSQSSSLRTELPQAATTS